MPSSKVILTDWANLNEPEEFEWDVKIPAFKISMYPFQQHGNQPIIREIKCPSHTFIHIHVHELTRSAQCINSVLQIDEIKDLFQVGGVIFPINGVGIGRTDQQEAFHIPGPQKTVFSQAADAHIKEFFLRGCPGGAVFQARYLKHDDVFSGGTCGRAELIHFRDAVVGAIEDINVTAVENVLLFRNHAKGGQGAIIQLGCGL